MHRIDEILDFLALTPEICQPLRELLIKQYGQGHRFYHNLQHLDSFYNVYLHHSHLVTFKKEFLLAMLFHDVIYDPERHDNEEESIELFLSQTELISFLKQSEQKCDIDLVVVMIRSTIKHQVFPADAEFSSRTDYIPDLELFLDCDLSILGSSQDDYLAYSQAIRKEYSCFSDPQYREGRIQVLKKLMGKKSLFFSGHRSQFFKDCERRAKENMLQEIDRLSLPL